MVRAGHKEAHPAGIWSDMTSDGPLIGTLVVVLDRAVCGLTPFVYRQRCQLTRDPEKPAQQEKNREAGSIRRRPPGKGGKAH